MSAENILFIPSNRRITRRESVAIDWLVFDADGEVCVWFDTSAMIFSLAPEHIPDELRSKGSLYAATDIDRLDDLERRCPDLRMAIGMFRSFAQRREIRFAPGEIEQRAEAVHHEP